ncbi:MAG: T9SS type A sorting domain-containing protein, partial [Calditrichaeota bacterium]|nr:T9SS type A sorting domain-containing protein [Calditrichota bacterium]
EGFALTGWGGRQYPMLKKISPQGNLNWEHQDDDGVPIERSHGTCLEKVPNGHGYYVVGRSSPDEIYFPIALRTTSQGVTRWQQVYDFGELENFQSGKNEFNSIAIARNGSPIAAGVVRHFEGDENHWSYDGILMKFAPEIVGPQFIYWSPEDTLITALPGDTLQFIARAESPFEEELVYGWSINDSLISRDTTVTVSFENLGNYILKCLVSDAETTISITWQIEVTDWYIAAFSPDSLNLQVGRGTNIPFTTNLRAVENEEMSRLWTYTGRDDQQEELGEGDSVDVNFNLSGVHHLQFEVWDDNRTEEIAWDVTVNSIVWSWVPQANVISAVEDTTITFEIIPFNEDSDSIECIWMINEAPFSVGLSSEVLFSDVGNYDVNAFVTESEDTDTIIWNIEILERQDVADNGSQELPAKPTLYPPSPNPFNSHIQIPVYTPDNCKVELSVFDVNGRKITSKILEGISGGNHIWTWHPKDCPAGLYLVRMQSRSSTQARKILLLK